MAISRRYLAWSFGQDCLPGVLSTLYAPWDAGLSSSTVVWLVLCRCCSFFGCTGSLLPHCPRLSQVTESRLRLLSSCGARTELLIAVASLVA